MFPEVLHHAYIVEGDMRKNKETILSLATNRLKVDIHGQDFFTIDADMFGVEDATRVVDINSRKAFSGLYKVVVITANTFSQQAQNALLKTLEEPTAGTHFFILTSTASTFLPTILSRVHIVRVGNGVSVLPSVLDVEAFLKGKPVKRIAMIKQIMKEKDDDKIGDREILQFVNQLERSVYDAWKGSKRELQIAKVFSKVQDYVRDVSSSKKLLLEYIALSI